MLITTTPGMAHIGGDSHRDAIRKQIENADSLKLAVAFVQMSGVRLLRDAIKRCIENRNGKIKLICSWDLEITDPTALQELKNIGVEIKLYDNQEGIFHPKLWLFGSRMKWACLISSANLSRGALENNVEIGTLLESDTTPEPIKQSLENFFEHLWSSKNAREATNEILEHWRKRNRVQARVTKEISKLDVKNSDLGYRLAQDFVKEWISMGREEQKMGSISKGGKKKSLFWRGWYIIPDHGFIDNGLISSLADICLEINESGGKLDISESSGDPAFQKILEIVGKRRVRKKAKLSQREAFIRMEKNYLINLNLAYHPYKSNGVENTDVLVLSRHGHKLGEETLLDERKSIYTAAVGERRCHGLNLLEATHLVLNKLKYLEFNEFNYFINHCFSREELSSAVSMVNVYRSLPTERREKFDAEYEDYFSENMPQNDVRMNYHKHVKHTMSALGWSVGFSFNEDSLRLTINPPD